MDNIEPRLINCFSAVFPELTVDEIIAATSDTVRGWDSVAGVTLIAAVEEEFDLHLDADSLAQFLSFQGFLVELTEKEAWIRRRN